ncbi:MAG: hypothetical protein OSB60_14765, partial [Myxococcota bacterium]|nr:hypothetical protein [Myxococcota bacterium]
GSPWSSNRPKQHVSNCRYKCVMKDQEGPRKEEPQPDEPALTKALRIHRRSLSQRDGLGAAR